MVISELTGGLGNQLFQYATGFALAQRQLSRYAIDIRHFEKHEKARAMDRTLPSRPFALDSLRISARTLTPVEALWCDASRFRTSERRTLRVLSKLPYPKINIITDVAEGDDPRLRTREHRVT